MFIDQSGVVTHIMLERPNGLYIVDERFFTGWVYL